MDANKKWLSIPKQFREQLIKNVWCSNCSGVTGISGFIVEDHEIGIVLRGKCTNCGHEVARVIENQ